MVAAAFAAVVTAAAAATAATPLSDEDLARQRGGFFSLAGFTFDFGVVSRTDVNGQLALQTSLTLGPDGVTTARSVGGAAAFQSAGLALSVAPDGTVSLADASGVTSINQTLSASQVRNTVFNTAAGRAISQTTSLNLVLPDFAQTQQALAMSQLASRLNGSIQSGLGIGH